jgi:hypothetical protein
VRRSVGTGAGNDAPGSDSKEESGYLPDEAVVVRGGGMRVGDLQASAEAYEAQYPGDFGLSFFSWPGLAVDDIAMKVRETYPALPGRRAVLAHPVLRKSTAGRIRAVVGSDGRSLRLEKTRVPGHYTVFLPSPPAPEDYVDLVDVFDPEEPNVARI